MCVCCTHPSRRDTASPEQISQITMPNLNSPCSRQRGNAAEDRCIMPRILERHPRWIVLEKHCSSYFSRKCHHRSHVDLESLLSFHFVLLSFSWVSVHEDREQIERSTQDFTATVLPFRAGHFPNIKAQ